MSGLSVFSRLQITFDFLWLVPAAFKSVKR